MSSISNLFIPVTISEFNTRLDEQFSLLEDVNTSEDDKCVIRITCILLQYIYNHHVYGKFEDKSPIRVGDLNVDYENLLNHMCEKLSFSESLKENIVNYYKLYSQEDTRVDVCFSVIRLNFREKELVQYGI